MLTHQVGEGRREGVSHCDGKMQQFHIKGFLCVVTEWLATLFPDMNQATRDLKNCEVSTLSLHDLEVGGVN